MKKFTFIGSFLTLACVTCFLIIGCKKEQASLGQQNQDAAENTNISSSMGTGAIVGLISKDHADDMSEAFARRFPDVRTKYVGYSTKNLISYLNTLLVKYKSDSVFVNFGYYTKETAPQKDYIGRSTIFFMGKDMRVRKGNARSMGAGDISEDPNGDDGSNYLNQGHAFP
jgi:hypothetical protein